MNKFYNIFLLIILISITASCKTVRDGFESQRKNSTEEFLVEKKKPLVMPPDYKELPIPKTDENNTELKENEIKNLLTDRTKDKENVSPDNNSTTFEESILEKIKNN